MRKIVLAKHKVELYDSLDELPIVRFHKYNKMLLIDAGVGSDLSDWDAHMEKVVRYCRLNQPDKAEKEIGNIRQNIYFIQSEISPKHLAFAALVKSIDGKLVDDLTDDGLQKVLDLFAEATNKELTDHMESVKKKIDEEMLLYFPMLFDDSTVKEYYDLLRERTLLMLNSTIEGVDRSNEIDDLTGQLITYTNPQSFSGTDSVEIQYDKQFENMCLMIAQHLHVNAKKYTVLEYYNAFEFIKKSLKSKNKSK